VTFEMFIVALPTLVTVNACGVEAPTFTLPKETLLGVTEICACGRMAVALKGTRRLAAEELLRIAMLPVIVLPDVGVKLAVNEALCPGPICMGNDKPEMLKPMPEGVASETFTPPVPPLVSVTV
jgi:hypothetical protein